MVLPAFRHLDPGGPMGMTKIGKQERRTRGVIAAAILFLAGGAAIAQAGWFDGIFRKSPAEIAKAAGVVETADAVRIPLSALDSGETLFLESDLEGRRVSFLPMRGPGCG